MRLRGMKAFILFFFVLKSGCLALGKLRLIETKSYWKYCPADNGWMDRWILTVDLLPVRGAGA